MGSAASAEASVSKENSLSANEQQDLVRYIEELKTLIKSVAPEAKIPELKSTPKARKQSRSRAKIRRAPPKN